MTTQTNIIRGMRQSTEVAPPDDFTKAVMHRLPADPQRSNLAASLFLVAFGYLVLGSVLAVGFSRLQPSSAVPPALLRQPQIIIGMSIFFLLFSTLSRLKSPLALFLIKAGLLFFLVFSTVNGIMVQLSINAIFPAYGIVLYSVTGLVLGLFLYTRIDLLRWVDS